MQRQSQRPGPRPGAWSFAVSIAFKTFDNFIQLSFLLEDLFKRRVELVTAESLSPHIGPFIMSEVEYVTVIT